MKKGRLVFRLLPAWLLMAVLLAGCGQPNLSALIPKGPVADMQLDLMWLSLVIMIIVVLVVSGIFIYVLIRFRARPGQEGRDSRTGGREYEAGNFVDRDSHHPAYDFGRADRDANLYARKGLQ